jgi:DNA-binding winged helix-turn-helix (wHTH) protein
MRLRFGDCTLDLDARQLVRSATPVHVEPLPFRLLELLILERPKALAKKELQERLWPRTFVSDHNLARLVFAIRTLIGDRAREPVYIRTIHGYGYAFTGDVTELPSRATDRRDTEYRLIWGEREFDLFPGENVMGRDPESAIWIDRDSVSRRHARIVLSGDTAILEDLGSKNGTSLSGRRIAAPERVSSGDEIKIGSARLVFCASRATGTTKSTEKP